MPSVIRRICAAVVVAAIAIPAQAALFEGFTGAWAPDIAGTLRNGATTYDLQGTLGLDADPQREFTLYFRPEKRWYWPDLSAGFDHLGAQGNGRTTSNVPVLFGTLTVPANSALYSTISINDYDVSADIPFDLYGVHFGAGVTVKYLVGDVLVHTVSTDAVVGLVTVPTTSDTRVNQVFPLVHLRAETELASWLSLVGSGRYVEYEGNRAYELRGQVDLRPLGPVTLSAGYQRKSYVVARGSYRLDTDIDGVFFGVGLLIR
jgi:hypothetical protein